MTSAIIFMVTVVAFILIEIAQLTFLNLPHPLPFVIGLILGPLLAWSGLDALSERTNRRELEQWKRRWR